MLMVFLAYLFIVDRDLGLVDAVKTSAEYMRGNKLTAFLIWLVASIVGGLLVMITCGIGALFVIPYMGVLAAVIYLSATGQPMYEPFPKKQMA